MSEQASPHTHKFEAEVSQVLSLVINSLYSNKDVFLRELISNAADALDKLRFESVQRPGLVPDGYKPAIKLIPDEQAKTLTISDNGIGMTAEALAKDLGTVARSGSKELIERLHKSDQKHDMKLIGQFGVGFYSGYLVADRIDVISRAAGSDAANKWTSAGKDTFMIEPAGRDEVGTSVVLHLKSEFEEYAREWKLRELVERYSNFISYPIELQVKRKKDDVDELKFETVNKANALVDALGERDQRGRVQRVLQASHARLRAAAVAQPLPRRRHADVHGPFVSARSARRSTCNIRSKSTACVCTCGACSSWTTAPSCCRRGCASCAA